MSKQCLLGYSDVLSFTIHTSSNCFKPRTRRCILSLGFYSGVGLYLKIIFEMVKYTLFFYKNTAYKNVRLEKLKN